MALQMITDQRGEVRVETGTGTILGAEPKGERNVKVTIRADHLRAHDLICWVDKQGPVWPRVEWALKNPNHKLWYRIDVHRTRGVAVEVPYDQLTNTQKVRDLVQLCKPEDAPADISAATPAPAAAPPPVTRPAAPAETSDRARSCAKALQQLGVALRSGQPAENITFLIEMATDLGATKQQIDQVADAARPAQPAQPARPAEPTQEQREQRSELPRDALNGTRDPDGVRERRPNPPVDEAGGGGEQGRPKMSRTSGLARSAPPIATDSRPWEITNTDGRLNLASYAAGAVLEFVNLAGRLLVRRARQRADEDPTYELHAPTRNQIFGLASQLMLCADTIQVKMREGGRVDRMSASHKVARQVVREGLDAFPVPWGASAEQREAWRESIIDHGLALTSVMLDILDNRGAPSETAPPAAEHPQGQPPAQTG